MRLKLIAARLILLGIMLALLIIGCKKSNTIVIFEHIPDSVYQKAKAFAAPYINGSDTLANGVLLNIITVDTAGSTIIFLCRYQDNWPIVYDPDKFRKQNFDPLARAIRLAITGKLTGDYYITELRVFDIAGGGNGYMRLIYWDWDSAYANLKRRRTFVLV